MAQFNVTELDFQNIKESIKDHFRSQSKYNDWDFNGSGLSLLLDILAYNTHYNAMVAHLSMNETFLDSAQIRGNVVSHAKLLGYVPRSVLAARAVVNLNVQAPTSNPSAFAQVERGTRFTTTINGQAYGFVVLDGSAQVSLVSGYYNFSDVILSQGQLKRMLYRVDNSVADQKFEIPDENVDTTTLRVRIKANEESNDYTKYERFSTLSGITSTSAVYFLQENASGKYEIYFGDGILGYKPINNNIVEIEYVYTDGTIANGASLFTAVDSIANGPAVTVTTTTASYGAADRESIDSIRYNAPLTFAAQNRAVTADDYRAIIQASPIGATIDAISVWGGENDPEPDFGKVYISIKPTGKEALNATEKKYITDTVLLNKNVVSITPVIVDPEYTYISLDVFFKYNPNLTDRTKITLQALVTDIIQRYANTNLKKFDGVFRYSKLLSAIDKCDPSILNSDARVFMYKDVTPRLSGVTYIDLKYSAPIYSTSSTEAVLHSTEFLLGGVTHIFQDVPASSGFNRPINLYRYVDGVKTYVKNVGIIYASDGRVVINGIVFDNDDEIRITVTPNSNDLAPKRNQLLDIDLIATTVVGEVDTIALAGAAGTIGYTTPSRHRY